MRISDQRKNEIVGAFQRSFKRDNSEEVATITLQELTQADEMLGARDKEAGFRIAMRNRIKALESAASKIEERSHESRIRIWNLLTGVLIGLVIAGLSKLLFG